MKVDTETLEEVRRAGYEAGVASRPEREDIHTAAHWRRWVSRVRQLHSEDRRQIDSVFAEGFKAGR